MSRLTELVDAELKRVEEITAARPKVDDREAQRRQRERAELHAKVRAAAATRARELLGRVLFPGRWDVSEGTNQWMRATAVFEGKIRLKYDWHPHTNVPNHFEVSPVVCPEGFDKWPVLESPDRPRLGAALLSWGIG